MCELTNSTEEEIEQILNKWTNPCRLSYATVQDCSLPKPYKEKLKKDIDNFLVFDDDIWICSYPKTGTTWVSELVWLLCKNFDYQGAKASTYDRIRFLELSVLFHTPNVPELKVHDAVGDSVNYTKNQPRPRFIKSHLPFHLLPKQIQTGERQPKIIYITRNPIDACISYYYHAASMGFSGTMEEFCKLFLTKKTCYGSFWDHVLPFWRMKDKANILFLRFEDMKKDIVKTIHQTAAFLGKSIPSEEMDRLLHHLSFEAMKNNPAVNGGEVVEFLKSFGDVKSPHIRSGSVGGYKKEMPEKFIKIYEKWIEDNTAGTGLTF